MNSTLIDNAALYCSGCWALLLSICGPVDAVVSDPLPVPGLKKRPC